MKQFAGSRLRLLLVLASVACHGATVENASPRGLPGDPEGCRSFATLGRVEVGRAPGELRCRFDTERAEQHCELVAGHQHISSVTEYASLADFVEEGHSLGKSTSLTETRVENGKTWRTRHHYDDLGRLVRSIEEAYRRTTITAYADYDAEGRPRSAVSTQSGASDDCDAWRISIDYSEASRSVSRRSRPQDPERCGFTESTEVERYDGAGNRVQIDTANGAGVARSFVARGATRSERICL